ncbi:hypothetical protein GCM10022227_01260 [Streptomyces sedi]
MRQPQFPPHWQEEPDWQPQLQPEPQPQAPGGVGETAMGESPLRRCVPLIGCPHHPGASTAQRQRAGVRPRATAVARGAQAPASGSGVNSSACSPVTRNTTRRAIDTAWSANRS